MTEEYPTHTKESYARLKFIGKMIYYSCIIVPLLVVVLVVISSLLGSVEKLAITTILLSFVLVFIRLKFLHPLLRMIVSASLVIFSTNFYESMWSIKNMIFYNEDLAFIATMTVLILGFIILILNMHHDFIDTSLSTIVVLIAYTTFVVLSFYVTLIDYHYNTSAFMQMGKFITILFMLLLINRSRKYEAPHILDSRIVS